jgi:3D (Asp-Asp-Asp) domain-containing protein
MKNLARGSVFFGILALLAFTFYLQPSVIAEDTFSIANDSQGNIQIEEFQNNTLENKEQNNFVNNLINYSENNNSVFSEFKAYKATAYCLRGRTASGGSVRRGIVAADPRILPLGTRIQLNAGNYSGTYVVADTGGGVKGRHLDIWVASCSEATRFGRRTVMVSVVGKK